MENVQHTEVERNPLVAAQNVAEGAFKHLQGFDKYSELNMHKGVGLIGTHMDPKLDSALPEQKALKLITNVGTQTGLW
ncbi:MAG: hypothetical protein Q8K75_05280 [Chlamydiales bacterium]|nr:hypothetical protein [Chlamydiales bacterium]